MRLSWIRRSLSRFSMNITGRSQHQSQGTEPQLYEEDYNGREELDFMETLNTHSDSDLVIDPSDAQVDMQIEEDQVPLHEEEGENEESQVEKTEKDTSHEEEIIQCPICLDPVCYQSQQPPTCTLPCRHLFHAKCILEIRAHSSRSKLLNACPLCRTELPRRADELFFRAMSRYNAIEKMLMPANGGICWNNLGTSDQHAMEGIISLFKLAAEQGHAEAQLNLGYMYSKGRGVAQSDQDAVHWYRFSASQGYPKALLNLGILYKVGRGVPQSNEKAMSLFTEAAEKGYDKAQYKIAYIHKNGSHGCAQDYAEAVKWYRMAALQGHADAQCSLGAMYRWGYGVKQDDVAAVSNYLNAAQQGHVTAQRNLGYMYENGCGVESCSSTASYWFRLAAEQGDTVAQASLSSIQLKDSNPSVISSEDQRSICLERYRSHAARSTVI